MPNAHKSCASSHAHNARLFGSVVLWHLLADGSAQCPDANMPTSNCNPWWPLAALQLHHPTLLVPAQTTDHKGTASRHKDNKQLSLLLHGHQMHTHCVGMC